MYSLGLMGVISMLAVVVVLIALVQLVQSAGDYLAHRVNRRLRHH